MKRLLSFTILLLLVGCAQSSVDETIITPAEEYYASFEESDSEQTRTYVDEQVRMRWHKEDYITLFKKNTYNRKFMFTGKTGANAGGFRQVSVDDEYWFGYDVDASYAAYPHSDDTELDESTCAITLTMPAEQTYAENSFGLEANTMVAVSSTNQLIFKNVGSYLRVRLYGDDTKISSITLTSKGNEAISGKAIVIPVMNGYPSCEMIGSGKSITLTCPSPVTISESVDSPTDFWIVVPPVTLKDGFVVTVKSSDDKKQTYNVDQSFTFARNTYYNLKREVTFGNEIEPTVVPNNQIWYSTTDGKVLALNSEAWLNVNIISNTYKNGKGIISFDKDINSIDMGAFYNCYSLKSITLPIGVVRIGSYAFYDCDSLESISIPDGVNEICANAFDGCNNLENVIIPASVTNIGSSAFKDCISLKSITIPNSVTRISSTTFYGCHNLENISIPENITEIGAAAFCSCTSLKSINIS